MKGLITALAMVIGLDSFAGTRKEYDEKSEKICHQELKSIGCLKDDKESKACAELNKGRLSPLCRELHEAQKRSINQ